MTLYPVLASAMYRVLSERSKSNIAVISHRTAGRSLGSALSDFTSSVGNFAIHYPVLVDVGDQSRLSLCRTTAAALSKVPLGGVGYDWWGKRLGDAFYPDEQLTPLRLNYLGTIPPARRGPFEFSRTEYN